MKPTGITDFESLVQLPSFLFQSHAERPDSFVEYYFLAHITLRSHLNRITTTLRYFSMMVPFHIRGCLIFALDYTIISNGQEIPP